MKRNVVFLILCICAAVLFAFDLVCAVFFAVKTALYIGGGAFSAGNYLVLAIVLIISNAVFVIAAAGYFIIKGVKNR